MLQIVFAIALLVGTYPFEIPEVGPESGETHCIARVTDQNAKGELVLEEVACFGSLGEALSVASAEFELGLSLGEVTATKLLTEPELSAAVSTFTLGIHFDGANGTGSSISIVGSECTGGHWNTGATWANRISSSWNGCYRLRHFDGPNKTGISASTTGVGQTDNLPGTMNNRTESVSYHSS